MSINARAMSMNTHAKSASFRHTSVV
jgi:hypothetical protein